MRKAVCFLLIFAIILPMNVSTIALENTSLSDLTDAECVAFLENNGIEIPGTYNDSMSWIPFIHAVIAKVEEDPNVQFAFGYIVALDFAYQIKSAVNAYYGVEGSSPYSLRSSDILQDNTVYGSWSSEYADFNCYAYAIDYYEFGRYTTPGLIEWVNNGNEESDFYYNWLANAYTVAGWVADDLESIGCTDVVMTTTIPTVEETDHTQVICVRIDTDGEQYYGIRDFHLMRLGENEYWYHKPGRTNPLRYNYTPTNSRIWVSEGYDGSTNTYFRDEEVTYDSDIWFIEYTTPHEWEYFSNHAGQHLKRCTICGDASGEYCVAGEYVYSGENSHQSVCCLCGTANDPETCVKEYIYSEDETLGDVHAEICTVCNHIYTAQESCTHEITDNGDGTHTAVCSVCGDSQVHSSDCQWEYSGSGTTHTHTKVCPECDYSETESCTFAFSYNGQVDGKNTHIQVCTVCGHSALGVINCVYNSNGLCKFCGTPKGYIPINREEEELLGA